MKKSKFNIVVPYHDKFIHYNMITKSIILSSTYSMDYRNSAYYDNGFFVDDSKDEIKELEDQAQKITDKYISQIDKAVETKTQEILTV